MKMDYETALQLAREVKELLEPFTTRCEIAGGVRRKKQQPHDIELVCVPKFHKELGHGLFMPIEMQTDMLGVRIQQLLSEKILEKGDPDKAGKRAPCGPKYYRLKYKGEKLDIFSVIKPAQWGTVFLIRTGDADFSHWFVQRLWKYGLRSLDGHIERTRVDHTGTEIHEICNTPEEIDAFKLCHVDYIEPENRTLVGMKAIII